MKQYIHFGSRKYRPEKFEPIHNIPYFPKPAGGLWASPVKCGWGWRDWCKDNNFKQCREINSFKFTLTKEANLLQINRVKQLSELPKLEDYLKIGFDSWELLDFEQMLSAGIDAIQVNISRDYGLYWRLYGWDCDSIVVLNKDVIISDKGGRK